MTMTMTIKRIRLTTQEGGGGEFSPFSSDLNFVRTGCTLLDLVISGGWPLGRIANIVGDKSTGKTLLAIEAAANFAKQYPEGEIHYAEAESAFDKSYAASLGMPIDRVKFSSPDTVEDFQEDLQKTARNLKRKGVPGLYILDSLDALSDRKELARDVDTPTYATDKPRQMSQLFRKLVRLVTEANLALVIISQVRDKIGISFGRKTSRSGGKALDYYASQVLYLSHMKTIVKTRRKQKRAVAVKIRAKCDKNKIGMPFRECDFQIRFGFGINSSAAALQWLIDANKQDLLGISKGEAIEIKKKLEALDRDIYKEWTRKVHKALRRGWVQVEKTFLPPFKKYE